jgi:hypothetical protein
MTVHRSIAALFFLCLGTALCAEPTAYDIGRQNAKITLDAPWRRVTLNKDFGRDQFVKDMKYFFYVSEYVELLDSDRDYAECLARITDAMQFMSQNAVLGNSGVKKINGRTCAFRVLDVTVQGVKATYYITLIGENCLYYVFFAWSTTSYSKLLQLEMDEVLRSYRPPEPGSAWAESSRRRFKSVSCGDATVEVLTIPALFDEIKENGKLLYLVSKNTKTKIIVFPEENIESVETSLRDIFAYLKQNNPDLREVRQEAIVLGDCEGRLGYFENGGDKPFSAWSLVVRLEGRSGIEIRLLADWPSAGIVEFFGQLLKGVRITKSELDAYPTPPKKPPRRFPVPVREALLAARPPVGSFPESIQNFGLSGNGIYGVGYKGLYRLDLTTGAAADVHLFPDSSYGDHPFAVKSDRIIVRRDGTTIVEITAGGTQELKLATAAIADAPGAGFFVARESGPLRRPPFDPSAGGREDSVVLIDAPGKETPVVTVPGDVKALALNGRGTKLLFVIDPPWTDPAASDRLKRIAVCDLATRAVQAIGTWREADHPVPFDDGWCLQGLPQTGRPGLYLITGDGKTSLLIAGRELKAIGVKDGAFLFASRLRPEGEEDSWATKYVYQAPLPLLQKNGPQCEPLQTDVLNAAGKLLIKDLKLRLDDPQLLTKRTALEACYRKLQSLLASLGATRLPAGPEEFDAMLEGLWSDPPINEEGYLALLVLFSKTLLNAGAEWVDGERSTLFRSLRPESRTYESAFACAYPVDYPLWSQLCEEEGWYNPAATIIDGAAGRAVLIGTDGEALAREIRKRNQPLAAKLAGNADRAGALDLIKRNPKNEYLRGQLYRAWYPKNAALIVAVVEALKLNGREDLKYFFTVKLEAGLKKEEIETTVRALREAVARFPDEADFYYLLGLAYKQSGTSDSLKKARACFRKADDCYAGGALKEAIQKELGSLSEP